ncbi:hypothetical protein RND71_015848 [Anisodus tanguticus]|uniref:deoxyhypusine monooxygenase n=1 Tax=Anisodus tanguticus TaxID=243964 RepID=A0AAE1S735_9SOLA|nr:hypothetical protein RND71_015848 [Anisodus tanguticus]
MELAEYKLTNLEIKSRNLSSFSDFVEKMTDQKGRPEVIGRQNVYVEANNHKGRPEVIGRQNVYVEANNHDCPRNALINATRDPSNLLAHEAAFALGQMQDADGIPSLERVLPDFSLHPIVRHEAAEALGAIGLEMDPAAPASYSSVEDLRKVLLSEEKGMYERYAALFALRNHGGEEAISAIIESLGSKSALLKHEVAYVLGQLQNKKASDAPSMTLKDVNEHPMVRHEAAEALGSIADAECLALLSDFAKDPNPIVSQSCEVALSMLEFEKSGKSFEFLFMQMPQVEQVS